MDTQASKHACNLNAAPEGALSDLLLPLVRVHVRLGTVFLQPFSSLSCPPPVHRVTRAVTAFCGVSSEMGMHTLSRPAWWLASMYALFWLRSSQAFLVGLSNLSPCSARHLTGGQIYAAPALDPAICSRPPSSSAHSSHRVGAVGGLRMQFGKQLPKNIKDSVTQLRGSIQAALSSRCSRMDVEMPYAANFGVEVLVYDSAPVFAQLCWTLLTLSKHIRFAICHQARSVAPTLRCKNGCSL